AMDLVVARVVHRCRSVRQRKGHTAQGAAIQAVLLDVRQQVEKVGTKYAGGGRIVADGGRQVLVRVVVVVSGQTELLEVVGALHAAGGFAHLLYRGQQQPDQNGDDRNHDKNLDQREGASRGGLSEREHGRHLSGRLRGLPRNGSNGGPRRVRY